MKKPEQRKNLWTKADNDELLEAIEGALDSIAGAMESLKGYYDFQDWFEALGDLYDEMKPDYDMHEHIASMEYEAEIEALTRDYYRSVL